MIYFRATDYQGRVETSYLDIPSLHLGRGKSAWGSKEEAVSWIGGTFRTGNNVKEDYDNIEKRLVQTPDGWRLPLNFIFGCKLGNYNYYKKFIINYVSTSKYLQIWDGKPARITDKVIQIIRKSKRQVDGDLFTPINLMYEYNVRDSINKRERGTFWLDLLWFDFMNWLKQGDWSINPFTQQEASLKYFNAMNDLMAYLTGDGELRTLIFDWLNDPFDIESKLSPEMKNRMAKYMPVEPITLYRGSKLQKIYKTIDTLHLNSATSWTLDPNVAKNFSGFNVVYKTTVTADRILIPIAYLIKPLGLNDRTAQLEQEVVLKAGDYQVEMTNV